MPLRRPVDAVWNLFRKEETPYGFRAICLGGCGYSAAGNVQRLKEHAAKCGKLQERLARGELGPFPQRSVSESPGTSQRPPRQLLLNPVSTTDSLREALNLQLCRVVLATNLPFHTVEHPEFKKLIEMLRPLVSLAGERQLSGELLTAVHSQCLAEI